MMAFKYFSLSKAMNSKCERILIEAAEALEQANAHDLSSLPTQLFEAISPLVPKSKHLELAQAIVETVREP